MWKGYIQGLLDYGSQVWAPVKSTQLLKLEILQKSYTNRIIDLSDCNHWEKLQKLKMYSVERRFQRYAIIYIWKVLENKVDNFGVKWNQNVRRGRMIELPARFPGNNTAANNLREQSLIIRGGRIFNKLPHSLRNTSDVTLDTFKHRLDMFLQEIPDHPNVPGLDPEPVCKFTNRQSNDIGDWIDNLHLQDRRPNADLVSLF